MQAGDAGIEGSLFARLGDDLVDGFCLVFEHLLDVGRVDAAVEGQAGQGAAGDLAADRVEAGDGHGFGRVVHDHVHAGGLLEGADVAAVAAHDAAFHLLVGQRDHRGGHFGDMLGGHPLDGVSDQLAGAFLALLAASSSIWRMMRAMSPRASFSTSPSRICRASSLPISAIC